MRTRIDRTGGALAALLLLALALSVLFASTAFGAPSSSAAGTQGRGGVALAPATPAAGTEGEGGVAAAASTSASGTPAAGSTAAVRSPVGAPLGGKGALVGRGRVPAAAARTTNAGWIAGGLAVAAVLIGFLFWGLSRGARGADEVAPVSSIGETPAQQASSQAQQPERKAA